MQTDYSTIFALADQGDEKTLETLRDFAASQDPYTRRAAIETIGKHPLGIGLRKLIVQALADRSAYVVRTACKVVAELKISAAHDRILELVNDKSSATRLTAICTLDAIWNDVDFPALMKIFSQEPQQKIRRKAAFVLRRHANNENWRNIFNAFQASEPPRHRVWACELAARFGGKDCLPTLARMATDPDGHVQKAASRAVRAISGNL